MNLFGGSISSLEQGLTYAAAKQKAVASNIANVDTPGYKAKTVSFDSFLEDAKKMEAYRTNSRHIPFAETGFSAGQRSSPFSYRHDGNGVDMDKEQAALAENQIYYNALVDRISSKFNTLQSVVKGGR
ncbi:flagellar basal body rod protein FlgB [Indiicoccus explosivorum]|uniref:flagellar basal body rod protein FlgB n=1 Tax=Indiicoccus explosivorum TaxID=1917864 RepID=UPI000B432412|nr:flagellar basal body rod protein FlgB [Indiicoccus explosivorum]